jgi:hypothetical protein
LLAHIHRAQALVERAGPTELALVVGVVNDHLGQAIDLALSHRSAFGEPVVRAVNSLDQALQQFLKRPKAQSVALVHLANYNSRLRELVGVKSGSNPADLHHERGDDSELKSQLVKSTLQVIAAHAQQGLTRLATRPSADREREVTGIAAELEPHIHVTSRWIESIPEAKRSVFQTDATEAASQLSLVHDWVTTRTNHRTMRSRFQKTIELFDGSLKQLGMPPVGQFHPETSGDTKTSGADEQRAFDAQHDKLLNVIDSLVSRQQATVRAFTSLAALKDEEDEPALLESILKSLIIAGLGHLGGMILGTLLTGSAKTMGASLVKRGTDQPSRLASVISRTTEVGIDTIQGVVGGALEDSVKTNPHDRARAHFIKSFEVAGSKQIERYKTNLANLKRDSDISTEEMAATTASFEANMERIVDGYGIQLATSWAVYVAQSNLGQVKDRDVLLTDLSHYFGKDTEDGGRIAGRGGRGGVLRLRLYVDEKTATPKIDHSETQVIGMNSEIKNMLVKSANHDISKIPLPKEIHVQAGMGQAVICVDERGTFRDSRNWGNVVQKTRFLEPSLFWAQHRQILKVF